MFRKHTIEEVAEFEHRQDEMLKEVETLKKELEFEPGISFEKCSSKVGSILIYFGNRYPDYSAWDYFVEIYDKIPQEHRLKIQLLKLYTHYPIKILEFVEYLKESLLSETADQRLVRLEENKQALNNHINPKGCITIYRGVNVDSLNEDFALSFTVDKERAEWFTNRFDKKGKKVITRTIPIEEVLLYTNKRSEEEVMVIPKCLRI